MLEILIENYKPISKIILYIFIIVIIFAYIYYKNFSNEIKNNWSKYRGKSYILPFAGLIKRNKNESILSATKTNFIKTIWNIVKKIFESLMKPIYPIIEIIINAFKKFLLILNSIRSQITIMRNFLFKLFEKMYIRLQNSLAAVIFFFLKLRETMKRSYGILTLLVYTIEHSYIFFESLMKSPLTKVGSWAEKIGVGMSIFTFGGLGIPMWHGALCFGPDTSILLNDGNSININNITLQHQLHNNNIIIAKLVISKVTNLYLINGVYVTGDHLILDKDQFRRVKELDSAVKIFIPPIDKLVSLITSNGLIHSNQLVFKDYLDSHDKIVNLNIRKLIFSYLNNSYCNNTDYGCNDLIAGISPKIIIKSTKIIGKVFINKNQLSLYNYNNDILSGNILVLHKNNWKRVCSIKEAIYLGKNTVPFIHLITTDNLIRTDNNIIRDFCETNDTYINNHIDSMIDKFINK